MKKLYNLDYLVEISGGDEAFIEDMLKDFIENAPLSMAELEDCVLAQNWSAAYEVAHRYIPTFEFVGAEAIRKELRNLETHVKLLVNLDTLPAIISNTKQELDKLIEEIKTDYKF